MITDMPSTQVLSMRNGWTAWCASAWCASARRFALILPLAFTVACSDDLGSGIKDPATFQNEGGALKLYRGVRSELQSGLVDFLQSSGLLSDELVDRSAGENGSLASTIGFDVRILPEGGTTEVGATEYSALQIIRGDAAQTIGILKKYAPNVSPALRGEMYASQGYAEIWLADLFCSGVPLSTVDFEKDFTYAPGSSTVDVYRHAAALFDTAESLSGDSARILNLARIGRGRALLGAGDFAAAAQAVANVPQGFVYEFSEVWSGPPGSTFSVFSRGSVTDTQGTNGLPYLSSHDPRTRAVRIGTNLSGIPILFPEKYGDTLATTPVVVADWVEAQLIKAEAALQTGNASWLTTLNDLRTTGTYMSIDTVVDDINTSVSPPDTTFRIDTAWMAGTGGVGGLGLLHDPGSDTARVSLLFRERAAWTFMTGHRQGDMRRLIRQYKRSSNRVYPVGRYPGGAGAYGGDVNAPVPSTERQNPYFKGCFNRNA